MSALDPWLPATSGCTVANGSKPRGHPAGIQAERSGCWMALWTGTKIWLPGLALAGVAMAIALAAALGGPDIAIPNTPGALAWV